MNKRNRRVVIALALLGTWVGPAPASEPPAASPEQIVGATYRVEPAYFVECHVPNAEVDKVLHAVAEAVKLEYGKYDKVAFIDAAGLEQFRPLDGSKAGQQASAGRAPTTNVSFSNTARRGHAEDGAGRHSQSTQLRGTGRLYPRGVANAQYRR